MERNHRRGLRCFVLVTGIVLAAATSADAIEVDLTDPNVFATGSINDALFWRFDPNGSTGTGVIDSFVRIQGAGIEKGYNTDGPIDPNMDTKTGLFTHSLQLLQVPKVTIGEVEYREFLLDINEILSKTKSLISLDVLKIHIESSPNMTGYDSSPFPFSAPVYDMGTGNWVKLDAALATGSGDGDMLAFIPESAFTGTDPNMYVYLYSEFGTNEPADGGFEEWAVAESPLVPEPATLSMLIISGGLLLLKTTRFRKLRK